MKQPPLVLQSTSNMCHHACGDVPGKMAPPVAPSNSSHTVVPTCHPLQPRHPSVSLISTRTSQRDRLCSQIPL